MPETSNLIWLDGSIPKSTRFDDTYYTKDDGLAESRHVFITGNRLISRWANTENPVIGELGFGTGLNFLATLAAWNNAQNANDKLETLTFFSVEKYPLETQDLQKALESWAELAPLQAPLLSQWHPHSAGWQQLLFPSAKLFLFIGDAFDFLAQLTMPIGAWYLDGFNPKTNPQMWSLPLFERLYQASSPGASLASYTAAGWVRRNLKQAGFHISKQKGFGHKREMITGQKDA